VRVLHVINSLQGGGAENLLLEMLPRFKNYVAKVSVITLLDKWAEEHDYLASKGIDVIALEAKRKYSPAIIQNLYKEHRKGKYNIIHSHLFPSQYFVALLPQAGKFFFYHGT